jgi:uncharacterized protein (UPF0332 family)
VAEILANSEEKDKEAIFRTSISRAYYAAYHEVAETYSYIKQIPRSDHVFDNHQQFIRTLRQEPKKSNFKTLGNQLNSLKSDRIKADYKLNDTVSCGTAKKSCSASKRIFEGCNACKQDK